MLHCGIKGIFMRGLGKTISRLTALRRAQASVNSAQGGRLTELSGFGTNPGALAGWVHVPQGLPEGAALVVVLHGCTQSAAGYDRGSGWSELADSHGFAVLFPEQARGNNANLCFNWYQPGDARRGRGEAASIAQMIGHLQAEYGVDPARVFINGLSAGGAMTAVMLAAYPELFAGGAIIAGLPFATANTLPQALERMRGQGGPGRSTLAARTRDAAPNKGPPPPLSVWHGTRDTIVDPANATTIVDVWRDLHGIGAAAGETERVGAHMVTRWRNPSGRTVVERFDIHGMGHGTPLDTRGSDACGTAGPHMLDAGICSTRVMAGRWGLLKDEARKRPSAAREEGERAILTRVHMPPRPRPQPQRASGVQGVIEDALRSAGLMR
jgi:poly(hydroxyalkanoate) depolymerase family esterase